MYFLQLSYSLILNTTLRFVSFTRRQFALPGMVDTVEKVGGFPISANSSSVYSTVSSSPVK